jgi:hypothetical protein
LSDDDIKAAKANAQREKEKEDALLQQDLPTLTDIVNTFD